MCQQCGTSVLDLSRHIKKVHTKEINYYCDICGLGTLFKSSKIGSNLILHEYIIHQSFEFRFGISHESTHDKR